MEKFLAAAGRGRSYEDALAHWAALPAYLARRHGDAGIIRYLRSRIETGEAECRAEMNRTAGAAAS